MANKTTPATTVIPPNAGDSNKSTPASKVAIPADIKKWLWLVVVAVAVIVGIALLVASVKRERAKVAQASTQTSMQTKVLTMQPGGKSERIPVPFQMRVKIDGKDYRHHCVYADGHEESFVQGERPCTGGDMPFVYATNLRTKDSNVITYSYVK